MNTYTEYPIFYPNPASELFEETVCTDTSPAVTCDHCGRTHFNSSSDCMEEGELEELAAKHDEDPAGYIPHHHPVGYGWFDGQQVIMECPCNMLGKIEAQILAEQRGIIRFLTLHAQEQANAARGTLESIDQLHQAQNPRTL